MKTKNWKLSTIFNLAIFQVVVVMTRFHSITPSPPVKHLEPRGVRGGGGASLMKRQEMVVGKFEFNSYGSVMWTLPELYYTPKRYHLNRNRLDY